MAVPQGRPTSGPAEPPNDLRAETHAFTHARTRCVVRAERMLATDHMRQMVISYEKSATRHKKKKKQRSARDRTYTHEIYNYSNRKHYF